MPTGMPTGDKTSVATEPTRPGAAGRQLGIRGPRRGLDRPQRHHRTSPAGPVRPGAGVPVPGEVARARACRWHGRVQLPEVTVAITAQPPGAGARSAPGDPSPRDRARPCQRELGFAVRQPGRPVDADSGHLAHPLPSATPGPVRARRGATSFGSSRLRTSSSRRRGRGSGPCRSPAVPWSVVTPGVDRERRRSGDPVRGRQAFGIPGDALVLSMFARVGPMKGQADFVHAMGRLATHYPRLYGVMCGPADKRLERTGTPCNSWWRNTASGNGSSSPVTCDRR